MSKSYKHVAEFEFPSSFGFGGSAGKTMVKAYCRGGPAKYAEGGKVTAKAAVHKHEDKMHPGETKTKLAAGGLARLKARRSGVLGSGSNKPQPTQGQVPQAAQDRRGPAARMIGKRGVPVAPSKPLIQANETSPLARIRAGIKR